MDTPIGLIALLANQISKDPVVMCAKMALLIGLNAKNVNPILKAHLAKNARMVMTSGHLAIFVYPML